jgi:uncharacterized protein (DUF362 family)
MVAENRVSVWQDLHLDYTDREGLRAALRAVLAPLGFGQADGMKALVRPGDTVLLKPNLVLHTVPDARSGLTSGELVRAVCELVLEALEGCGRIIIADVPLQSARFDEVVRMTGLRAAVDDLRAAGAPVELRDLRQEWLEVVDGMHRGLHRLPGDPLGYTVVNLGDASELEPLDAHRAKFAVGDYDRESTAKYHMSSSRNEYLIPNTVLSADVMINLPKLKTHIKSGITGALKNLVGTCGHKSYLPHFRAGGPADGGDEFAVDSVAKVLQREAIERLKGTNRLLYAAARAVGRRVLRVAMARKPADLRMIMSGSWYGNDTLWRTILDLNKIARYAGRDGVLREEPQRRYLCIVDAVFAGEGDGPLTPETRHDGLLLAGASPVMVDLVACLLMGVDPAAVRQVHRGFSVRRFPLTTLSYEEARDHLAALVVSNVWPLPDLHFRLPTGWDGHISRDVGWPPQRSAP